MIRIECLKYSSAISETESFAYHVIREWFHNALQLLCGFARVYGVFIFYSINLLCADHDWDVKYT